MLVVVGCNPLVIVAQGRVLLGIEQHKATGKDVLDVNDAGAWSCLDHQDRVFGPGQLSWLRRAFNCVADRQVVDCIVDHLLGEVKVDRRSPPLL